MAEKVNETVIDEIAHLARLEFNANEKQQIATDLNRMLGFIDKLNELNTDNVEPLIYLSNEHTILREDEAGSSLSTKEALKNAAKKDSDYFKAPKVIG